jgi:hypothetical protein
MQPLLRRTGAFLASSVLLVSGATLLGGPANATADPHPVTIGADWLASQLVNGLQQNSGYVDVGLTIDTASALQDVGGHSADIAAISDAIAPQLVTTGEGNYGYAESDEYSYDKNGVAKFAQKGYYASGLAKSLYFAENFGISDISTWAGADLQADLEGIVTATGPSEGRLVDNSSYGDYANVLSQAYAVNGLEKAGSAKAVDVLSFLLQQQCGAGYFRLHFTTSYSAPDQTCDGGQTSGASAPDPDVTAEATRLLLPLAQTDPVVARRVGKAEAWLLAQQHADGSFGGGTSTTGANANSTGLAGWLLMDLGDTDAANRAAVWIRQHQADELAGCANGLSGSATGAIGYDDAGVAAGAKSGLGSSVSTWVRASSQAVPVLKVLQTTTPALAATPPIGYVKAGSTATFTVKGVVPGDKVCLTGSYGTVRAAAGVNGQAVVGLKVPAGTATRTLKVTDRAGTTKTVTTKVLGVKRLTVKSSAAKPRKGRRVTVTVSGLAVGEKVTLRYRGKVAATGTATAAGTFSHKVSVGKKLGSAKLAAFGQFADIRTGSKTIKVVR